MACSSEAERGQSDRGLKETLEKAGLKVDYIEISAEVNADSSARRADPHRLPRQQPRREGDRHPAWRRHLADRPRRWRQAGKKPGEVVVGGIDLAPATIDGLEDGWISVTLDQQLYLQGFLPVTQCVLSAKYGFTGRRHEHRRRRGHAADDRGAGAADREGHPLGRNSPAARLVEDPEPGPRRGEPEA